MLWHLLGFVCTGVPMRQSKRLTWVTSCFTRLRWLGPREEAQNEADSRALGGDPRTMGGARVTVREGN